MRGGRGQSREVGGNCVGLPVIKKQLCLFLVVELAGTIEGSLGVQKVKAIVLHCFSDVPS